MKLYEISLKLEETWNNLQAKLDDLAQLALELNDVEVKIRENELYAQYETELQSLEGTHAEKCLDIASYTKSLEAEAEAIKAEEDKLKARRKRNERSIDFLKTYLRNHMEPGHNLKNSHCVISWRKSSGVIVTCKAEDLPKEYQRVTIFVDAKKDALKEALLAGDEALQGKAMIEERHNIIIK